MNLKKGFSLLMLSALILVGCDSGSTSISTPDVLGAANNTPEAEPTTVATLSRIAGDITFFNNVTSTDDIRVSIRDSNVSSSVDSNGNYELILPIADIDRSLVLDITGSSVMQKSVPVLVPAEATLVLVDADVAARSPGIPFSLENGGQLQNAQSKTRVSVTVPPNAFEHSDGTLAIGEAHAHITEVDIEDLYGESAWAPNLIGIAEGGTEPGAIITFGMSDFHFAQNGEELQLRSGVEATLKWDLVGPWVMGENDLAPVPAYEGAIMPLWNYHVDDMVWKEEGHAVIRADDESQSGFSLYGDVSHFSPWNVDAPIIIPPVVPPVPPIDPPVPPEPPVTTLNINVIVQLLDFGGNINTEEEVVSYSTQSRIASGTGWDYTAQWVNARQMTPTDNSIQIIANVWPSEFSASTTMEFVIDNVIVKDKDKKVNLLPVVQRATFNYYDGGVTVLVRIPVIDL